MAAGRTASCRRPMTAARAGRTTTRAAPVVKAGAGRTELHCSAGMPGFFAWLSVSSSSSSPPPPPPRFLAGRQNLITGGIRLPPPPSPPPPLSHVALLPAVRDRIRQRDRVQDQVDQPRGLFNRGPGSAPPARATGRRSQGNPQRQEDARHGRSDRGLVPQAVGTDSAMNLVGAHGHVMRGEGAAPTAQSRRLSATSTRTAT